MQPLPEPGSVQALLRETGFTATSHTAAEAGAIGELITRAAQAAHTVTGGAGFDDTGTFLEPVIADILVRSVARTLMNPEVALSEAEPPFTAHPGSFPDWSHADFLVLQRYRERAAQESDREH